MGPDAFAAQSFLDAALAGRSASSGPQISAAQDPEAAARDFEKFFLSQVLETLQQGLSTEAPFGGGSGETAWKSFLNEAYAEAMVRAGGIGLADRLKAEIIALQSEENI
ncbi:MAG: rod-binding protein [Maricaulaceae bacterium]|jgi:Rod binding domain-containing protein